MSLVSPHMKKHLELMSVDLQVPQRHFNLKLLNIHKYGSSKDRFFYDPEN
ncbi:MAG: hypothetical protein RBG13Loki_1459 [Promethearchaeota archaeon CR_4]|nr:MAG: hypothetical protein RBG13Loki_1459 [Candidatus Lokiarchaeota archaeon CR_4]